MIKTSNYKKVYNKRQSYYVNIMKYGGLDEYVRSKKRKWEDILSTD